MKRHPYLIAAVLAASILFSAFPAYAGWKQENGTYAYYDKDGQRVTNEFKKSASSWCYLDETGYIVKDCTREIDGLYYTFDPEGRCVMDLDDLSGVFVAISIDQQKANLKYNPYKDDSTVQWFNATCAVLTRQNKENIRAFGGVLQTVASGPAGGVSADSVLARKKQKVLEESWNGTGRSSADRVLEELLASGRVTGSAWDYSRAMTNLGNYYQAGYYTETEALDKSLEVAKEIQGKFDSWDSFMESYLAGYETWSGDTSGTRRTIYENLKASVWNPYAVDWNLELVKSW